MEQVVRYVEIYDEPFSDLDTDYWNFNIHCGSCCEAFADEVLTCHSCLTEACSNCMEAREIVDPKNPWERLHGGRTYCSSCAEVEMSYNPNQQIFDLIVEAV